MATPEEDKVKQLVELMDKFGNKTKALADALDKLKLSTVSTRDGVERANRERIVETDLIKKAQKEYRDLVKEQLEGKKTQREVNEEMIRQRKLIRENTELSAEQKASMLAALDTARVRGAAEARAADASERYGKAVDTASKIFTPAMQAVTGVLRGISSKDLLGGAGEILQAEAKFVSSAAGGIGQGLLAAAPAIAGFGKYGKILAGAAAVAGIGLQAFGGVVNGLSQIIGPMTNIIKEFSENYTKASQAGVMLGGGMGELREIAGRAGVRMGELVDGVISGQEAFQRAGLSVTQATRMVGTFGKGLIEGRDATALFALGYTDASSRIKLAAGAFDQARAAGMSQADAQKNIAQLTVDYAKDLKTLQAIVGANAEKELEKARAEAQRGALLSKLDADQAKAFTDVYASLDKFGPQADKVRLGLSQLANNGVITDPDILLNKPLMEMLQTMNQTVQSGSKNAMDEAVRAMSKAGEDTRAEIKSGGFLAGIDQANVAMGKNADAQVASIAALGNYTAALRINADAAAEAKKDADKQASAPDPTTAQMDKIVQNQRKLSVALEQAATSVGAIQLFGKALEAAQKPLLELTDMINRAVRGENISGGIMSAIGEVLKDIAITLGTGALAGLIYNKLTGGGGGAGGGFMNKLFGGVGGPAPPSVSPPGGGGGGLGGAGGGAGGLIGNVADGMSKLGPMLSSIGKGAGEAIGGIMQGIATGLAAFAKPQILLGATILGASITIIGAGIAGGAWIMGKALPTLAEGLGGFANINGENLVSVGKGVAALGAALAVFGVGGALGTVGNNFSSIVEGVGKFFGGKSQVEKLQEFAKIGPGLNQAADGISKFTTQLKQLVATDISHIEKIAGSLENLKKANEKSLGSRVMDFVFGSSKSTVTPSTAPTAGAVAPNAIAATAPGVVALSGNVPGMTPETRSTLTQTRQQMGSGLGLPKQREFQQQVAQNTSVLTEESALKRQEYEQRERDKTEEISMRDQNKAILEQTMVSMQSIESQMRSLLDYSRQIVDHTEATARGVR